MSPTRALTALFVALALASGLSGCGETRGRGGRGVLVIAVDGLRFDHTGAGGYDRPTTPNLDALATQGASFRQAFSAAPERIPAHVAVLTGCDPLLAKLPPLPAGTSRALAGDWQLPVAVPSLAREFLAAGYATAAFIDHPWLSDRTGVDHGFERFLGYGQGIEPGQSAGGFEAGARRFMHWLRGLESRRDWFAYVTVDDLGGDWGGRDPNWATYFPPRPELDAVPPIGAVDQLFFAVPRRAWPGGSHSLGEYEARYDGRVRRLDDQIGRLLGQLSATGRLRETTVCIVGTFGIGFGESGLILDSGTLSDVDLHVPWILRPPASFEGRRGASIERLASTLDVAPTLLELAGIELPSGVHGRSQLAALRGAREPVRAHAFARGGVHGGFAVRDARYSFERIVPGAGGATTLVRTWGGDRRGRREPEREHLRDRTAAGGPGDLEPPAEAPEVAAALRASGEEWYARVGRARDALQRVPWETEPVGAEELAELRRLGLVPDGVTPAGP